MKVIKEICLLICSVICIVTIGYAQRGYYDAPYTRYEADKGILSNAFLTPRSFAQADLQSEASEQVCVNMSAGGASVEWTLTSEGDGLVVRYSVPDGESGALDVYANNVHVGTLNLTSYYSWEYLATNGNPNNVGVVNYNPKMRFDEVRMRLPSKIPAGGKLKLVRQSGNIHLDFAELESVPAAIASYGSVYNGDGSDLQNFINANDGNGNTIFLPPGIYYVNSQIYFDEANTTIRGAGMWYTQIHFTNGSANNGGLRANADNISIRDLYLTTVRNSRSNSYKAINGVFTNGAVINNVWAEHFECGAWIAQYSNGPAIANNFTVSHCRFRNNYADGINLCKGTQNAIVEHCSFRNNGDDDMAIWSANGQECRNNTFRYNTSENTWRSSGVAIYGGYNNIAHNILIQDNLEVGIKVNNAFAGAPFNTGGMHELYNITIKRCGTNNDLFNNAVGAIDLGCYDWGAGTWVRNVKFSCINILDSKNDAIYIHKISGGGFSNIIFENINIDGTGLEYPGNNNGGNTNRGFMVLFHGWPGGDATFCGMTYSNRGGNASQDVGQGEKGAMSWSSAGSCPGGCVHEAGGSITITSSNTFGICDEPLVLSATTDPPSGNSVNYVEFFVDNVSVGQDNSSPYSIVWNKPSAGAYQVKATAYYSGGTSSTSAIQSVSVVNGIYQTTSIPVIDGVADGLWGGFAAESINNVLVGTISGAADLSATFKAIRSATHLYLLVDVNDDDLRNDGGFNWENDALEVFIDMGNDKNTSYGTNDYRYSFVYNDNTVYEEEHNATAGVVFAQTVKAGGYIMEISIPWSTLGGAPATGSFIGFDIHVNDDDGGGSRDSKIAWSKGDGTDNAWQNPSLLGTLQIAGCDNPLPVEFLYVDAEIINQTVLLNWATVSEVDNDKFIIERSVDLDNWQQVGEVGGAGKVNSVTLYNYQDYSPYNGLSYYRIKQIDLNGKYTYSKAIAVESYPYSVHVSPNPFVDELSIHYDALGIVEITITDLAGKIVHSSQVNNESGKVNISPSLDAGVYMLKIRQEDYIENIKVIRM
ncbi:MAG TPA: sugar-binding protein [Cytophagaceae bacterium]